MIPSLASTLRRLPLAKLRAYRNIRYQRGLAVVMNRWHHAKYAIEQHPDWPPVQAEWATAEATRRQWEAGLAEIDVLIVERMPAQRRMWEEEAI